MNRLIKQLVRFFVPTQNSDAKVRVRQKRNAELRVNKASDFNRWQNNDELFSDWDERTLILGSFIKINAKIIEFGAGNMVLKKRLTHYLSYTPSDIVQRYEETIVCDLNQKISFDLTQFDVAVFSGVLEYVFDVEEVIRQVSEASIKQLVLSYCCADIVKSSRDKNGWLSDYVKSDLEEIFKKFGYKIVRYQEWRKQSLYNLTKK